MSEKKEQPSKEQESQTVYQQLSDIENRRKEFDAETALTVEKALKSGTPSEMVKAMNVVKIESNDGSDYRKSEFVDPMNFYDNFGYKQPPRQLTYDTLFAMGKSPIVNAIIMTRKNQVAQFSQPQKDRHSTGFIIRKKGHFVEDEKKLTKKDRARIDELTEFILNCGVDQSWSRDSFDTFLRKFTEDSLTYDQANFEVVRDRGGSVHEFLMTDSTTMRIADSFIDKNYKGNRAQVGGHYPSYVQMMQEQTVAEFYAWELSFSTRNPSSRIHSSGYGRSELEDMVSTVTSMLWSDQYNRNFFKHGASPKGMLRIKSGSNNSKLQEFRQQWKSMIAGVSNSWRTPILDAENMEWIDLQKSHRDMEFTKWQEYLIKLACSLYTISPEEIGFASGNSQGGQAMFESNNAQRIKYSKDKGLKPLLKFAQAEFNKYIVSQIYPDLVFEFVGMDAETEEQHMAKIKDEVQNFKTINEVRKEANLKPIDGGDIVLNPTYTAAQQQAAMMEQQQGEEEGGGGFGGGEFESGSAEFAPEPNEGGEEEEPQEGSPFGDDDNPFSKAFNDMINDLNKGTI